MNDWKISSEYGWSFVVECFWTFIVGEAKILSVRGTILSRRPFDPFPPDTTEGETQAMEHETGHRQI
jgi:hypothetical protein